MQKNIIQIVHELVLENELSARGVAEQLSKPYSTLLREINQYDKSAKLGVETLLDLMRLTRNVAPLEFMARELGFKLVPAQQPEKRLPTPLRVAKCMHPRLDAANG